MAKEFHDLTIGQIVALKDTEIDEYAAEVGKYHVEKNLPKIEMDAGRRIIKAQIKVLKEMIAA